MSAPNKIAEFPDVEAKLQKPTKQSAFERQKAEAEAKRLREAAETAAVYEDFIKSFDADADDDERNHSDRGSGGFGRPPQPRGGGFGGGAGGGRRHFGAPAAPGGMKASGPGSLGPAPPPISFGKKRTYDGFQTNNDRRRDHSATGSGRLGAGFDDNELGQKPISKAFDASDDEEEHTGLDRSEEKAVARPTLRLANLPPATSPAAIRALIPTNLVVEGVKILSHSAPGVTGTDRKSIAAIVTLSQETAASEIDAAVSALQNRYLGFGYYLSLHRHLSSAAIAAGSMTNVTVSTVSHPFGAKPVAQPGPASGPDTRGRFAPPSSYNQMGAVNRGVLLHVPVQPPSDIKQLRMIHKVVESVLEHGPEFEALLMSRPDVQKEEKWAWIWDARSQGGIWYRWRLWEILTGGGQSRRERGKYLPLFDGGSAWKVPDKQLAYEYTTGVDGFVSESEYDSEFDDEDEDEPKIITEGAKEPDEVFLNPIEKAKLVHLLSRLPTTLSKIRKGDIARITAFAIMHSNRGADEIVDLIVTNLEKPLSFSSANPDHLNDAGPDQPKDDSRDTSPTPKDPDPASRDTSGAKLVGLYVISDILSSSSTSGVRHAWRYRQLLEAALKARRSFEGLGQLPERLSWGRLRAEKWRRSIGLVLSLWDGWCVFPNDSQELFVRSFENPPSLRKDDDDDEELKAEAKRAAAGGSRWKTVDAAAVAEVSAAEDGLPAEGADSDGSYDEYTDDEEADNELLARYHIDGEPLLDIDIVGLALDGEDDIQMGEDSGGGFASNVKKEEGTPDTETKAGSLSKMASSSSLGPGGKRKRVTAADMFADSDSDGGN